ncbi:SDR family oxidoreductase [Aurantibacillus circumpalustris]|uniref:SDR family oxidoreductase n=1 Tax=Aurantibacillus circumpalustris TaxID=3036359 RepID=UPI00295A8B4B|nr:SDR family oxidoreductase [Aurantibacillus circumpalustris]
MGKLNNKTALVTGAASGMGKAIAQLFAKEGANVIVADLHQNEIDEVVNTITIDGGKALGVLCDVSNEKDIKKMFNAAVAHFKTVDVLINNAGIMDDFMPIDQVSNDLWNRIMAVNVNGPMYACRFAVPIMLKQESGVIVNIASVGGLYGARAGVAYTASKHAVVGLTKNIGFMYAQKGIRCNAIAPGGVNTNIGKNMNPNPFGMERGMAGVATMPRMGEADEIAKTALFLASADSSFVNGTVLTADGGWTAY